MEQMESGIQLPPAPIHEEGEANLRDPAGLGRRLISHPDGTTETVDDSNTSEAKARKTWRENQS